MTESTPVATRTPMPRRALLGAGLGLAGLALAGLRGPAFGAVADGAPLRLGASTLRFATVEQGRTALAQDDEWVAATSALQQAGLMGVAPPVDRAAFLAFQAEAALPWSEGDRERWSAALRDMRPAFERLRAPLPPEVLLVHSSGRESADTPHTRGPAVVLPMRFEQQGYSDVELLAHELFHVLSRYEPGLRTRLYATIGFEPMAELEWPAAWRELRIANPDAPHHRHAMRLTHERRTMVLMPLGVSDHAPLTPGENLMEALETRLLEVHPGVNGAPTRAVLRGAEPRWHPVDSVPAYLARLGGNTDYTLHPEETLADNFMFLVSGRKVRNPALLRRIDAVFRSQPS